MKKKFQFYFFLLWVWCGQCRADADDEPIASSTPASTANSSDKIVIDESLQAEAGIKTLVLESANYNPEILAYGVALSIEPLLMIRNQYLNATAQHSSAAAKAALAQQNISRLNTLHAEQIVSTKTLQDQQSTWQTENAALNASSYQSQAIKQTALLGWGEKLTDWAIHSSNSDFSQFLAGSSTLLKVSLPPNVNLNKEQTRIFVSYNAEREQAVQADLIAPTPVNDNFLQGEQYFFQTQSDKIKAGMRVRVWIPTAQTSKTGVIIPTSALIWHLGQALVFVKTGAEEFEQHQLSAYQRTEHGYFVADMQLKPGTELVSTGAQILLSQQFKAQIPDEDDD